MTPSQCLAILRGRWRLVLATTLLVAVAALAVSLLLPARYTARAQVLVDFKGPDPARSRIPPEQALSAFIATQVDLVTSQKVALGAVEALRLHEAPAEIERWRRDTDGIGSIRHYLADRLFRDLEVRPERDSSLLTIAYTGTDPAFSAAVANAFAQAYVDTSARIQAEPARGAGGAVSTQLRALRVRLDEARSKLSAFQREHGIVAVDERLDLGAARLAELAAQLTMVRAQVQDEATATGAAAGRSVARREAELQAAVEAQRASVQRLRQVRDELGALQADVDSAQRHHDLVAARYGPSAVQGPGAQATVLLLNPAVEPVRPSSPRWLLNTAVSIGVGGLLGIALAFAAELRRRRIRSPADLDEAAAAPVMGVLRDRHARPSRRTRARGAARAGTPVPGAGPGPGDAQARPAPDADPFVPTLSRVLPDEPPDTIPAPSRAPRGEPVTADAAPSRAAAPPRAAAPSRAATPSGAAGPTAARRQPLGRIMVDAGMIQAPAVERILAWARHEGIRFGEAAVQSRLATEAQVRRALAFQFDYPVLEPGARGVSDEVVTAFESHTPVVADLRRLRSQIHALRSGPQGRRPLQVIAVVSPGPGEGRTFVAANLAVTFSQMGQRTLLIDGDLATGRIHELFGFENRTGLSAMLNDRILPGAIRRVPALRGLTVITSGGEAPNTTDLLSRDTFEYLLGSFRKLYDVVLIDTPAAADDADAELIARRAGACVIVSREGRSDFDAVRRLSADLEAAGVARIGSVLIRA